MVNVVEVKAKFSEYLDRAARGEQILICRHNKPVAELRAVEAARAEPRPIGPLPGRPTFEVPSSFFEPLPDDELDSWEAVGPADPLSSVRRAPAASGVPRVAEAKGRYGARAPRRPARRRS